MIEILMCAVLFILVFIFAVLLGIFGVINEIKDKSDNKK